MAKQEQGGKVSFATFFLLWADLQGWEVPDIHIAICHFLEHCPARTRVLRVFRGCGKSTTIDIYNAWLYYRDPTYRILHQGADDTTANKASRDVKNILAKHPLTRNMAMSLQGSVEFWWTAQAYFKDPRNPSMQAKGINANITSSRADYAQNDDVEVQKNVVTQEGREKVRHRLAEQIHILVPGSRRDFIGTPHTHNSLYDELIERGAEHLTIPMFGKEQRFEDEIDTATEFKCKFKPEYIFVGVGKFCWAPEEGKHYYYKDKTLFFYNPPGGIIDIYGDAAWPQRFTIEEMTVRRQECNTLNEWDSQYQLHAKPVHDVRLDPDRIIPYEVEPIVRTANKQAVMYLGNVQIVGASAYWDCALGKVGNDPSTFSIIFTDNMGRLYWHVCEGLMGDVDEQCKAIRRYVEKYSLARVTVETNGIGGFVPPILKKHLKGTQCGVGECTRSTNKQKYILDALEPPLSSGFLWASMEVLNGPMWDEMQEFNPKVSDQQDSYIDSGAGAIKQTPVRISNMVGKPAHSRSENWRPNQGQFTVQTDYDRTSSNTL